MNWGIWFRKLGIGLLFAVIGFSVDYAIQYVTNNPLPTAQYVVPIVMIALQQLKNYLAHIND